MEYNFNYKLKFQVSLHLHHLSQVCARCPSSAHVVHVWLARGLLTWLLEFEPSNLQDFPAFILGFHGCKAYP